MKKNGFAGFFRRKQYLIAGAVVVIAIVGTTMLYSSRQEKQREQLEAELADEMNQQQELAAATEDTEDAAEASAVIQPESTEEKRPDAGTNNTKKNTGTGTDKTGWPKPVETQPEQPAEVQGEPEAPADATGETGGELTAEEPAEETVVQSEPLHFAPENGLLWPMEGNVILNYSMDATVYFPTLDQYKYNPAIIISGAVNDKVISVARGQVTDISTNEVTGCTMTVDLGDGYQAVYGQLKEPNFAVGDYVESGHVLAYIGEPTKYFSVEGSNLYFALEKDGEPVDPVEFFD